MCIRDVLRVPVHRPGREASCSKPNIASRAALRMSSICRCIPKLFGWARQHGAESQCSPLWTATGERGVRRHVRKMARQILRTPLAKRFVDSCALDIAWPEDPPNPPNHGVFIRFSFIKSVTISAKVDLPAPGGPAIAIRFRSFLGLRDCTLSSIPLAISWAVIFYFSFYRTSSFRLREIG